MIQARLLRGRSFHISPSLAEWIGAPLLMAAVFLTALGHLLRGDRSFATFQDNTYLILPLFHHISSGFAAGEYPYWINTIVGGIPLYSNPQFSLLYPLYFFHWGLYGTPFNAIIEIHRLVMLHVFLGYINTYIFLRVAGLRILPAVVGATMFALSANQFSYGSWIMLVASYSWLPLVLASVILILEDRHVVAGVLVGALSFSLLILACPAQPIIHSAYAIAALCVFFAIRALRHKDYAALRHATRNLSVMAVLTVLIAAPVIMPLMAAGGGFIRWVGAAAPLIGFQKIPFSAYTLGQLSLPELAATLFPSALTTPIGQPFIGPSTAFLACFSIFKARSNWIVYPMLFVAAYALASATGTHLGLAYVNYYLPGLNLIREPGRHLILFVLAASFLAATGFSYVIDGLAVGLKFLRWKHIVVSIIFTALLILAATAALPYIGELSRPGLTLIFVLSLTALLLTPYCTGWRQAGMTIVAATLIVFGALEFPWNVPRLQDGDYFGAPNLRAHNVLSKVAEFDPARSFRWIFDDGSLSSEYWSMDASYYGIRSFQAYMNPLPYRQFDEVFQRFNLRNYYPLLGAKYYLCNRCNKMLTRDYRLEARRYGFSLYSSPKALPRYAIINEVAGSYETADDFYDAINRGFDFSRAAYIEKPAVSVVEDWLGKQPSPAAYTLRSERSTPDEAIVSVNTVNRAVFLFNEYNTPDWRAMVNGVAAPVFRMNLNQMGVLLDRGANVVEFQYRPTLFLWMLWLQRFTLMLIAAYVVIRCYRSLNIAASNLERNE